MAPSPAPDEMQSPKKKYVSRSLERHVRATRERTWPVLLGVLAGEGGGDATEGEPAPHGVGSVLHPALDPGSPLVETVLSFEPPWRRCARLEGATTGLDHVEGTFVLRDDGPECHLAWGIVVDPDPSPQGWAFLERALAGMDAVLDRVVAAAESEGS